MTSLPRAALHTVHRARVTELHSRLSTDERPTSNDERLSVAPPLFRNTLPPPAFRQFSSRPSPLFPSESLRKRCGKSIAFLRMKIVCKTCGKTPENLRIPGGRLV